MRRYFRPRARSRSRGFEADVPSISIDPAQIKQVFLNILINAVEAMPDGGDLNISIKSGIESIEIDITDSGKSIPQDLLQNIFDPFFTTKPNGTGVGLSVSLKI